MQLDKVQQAMAYAERTVSEYKDGPDFETLVFLDDARETLKFCPGLQGVISNLLALLVDSELPELERVPITDPAVRLWYEYMFATDLRHFASIIIRQPPKDPEYRNLEAFAMVVFKARHIVRDAIESSGVHLFLAQNRDKIRVALQRHARTELDNLQLMAAYMDDEIQESVSRISNALSAYLQPGGRTEPTPPPPLPRTQPQPPYGYTTPVPPPP